MEVLCKFYAAFQLLDATATVTVGHILLVSPA